MHGGEWIDICHSSVNLRICHLLLHSYDVVNHIFSLSVFVIRALNKDVSHSSLLDLLLGYLNLSSTLELKLSDCLSTFSNDKPNDIIWHRNDICRSIWWTVRRHHRIIIQDLGSNLSVSVIAQSRTLLLVLKLGGNCQLLLSNLVSGSLIRAQDSINNLGCFCNIVLGLSDYQDVLLIFIVGLWS
jgi:hypothetical protein